jgi:hypothetical protein
MRVSDLVRVARTCSVRGAVNHESKERNDRYTFAGSGLVAVLGIAAVTTAITVGLLMPRGVSAEGEVKNINPTISQPELTVDGCQFTLSMDKQEYAPGEAPVLTVVATNPNREPVATSATMSITATSPRSMMSRRLVLPKPLWTRTCPVDLQPGESRAFTFETDAALPAGQIVSVSMFGKQHAVIANLLDVQRTLNVPQQSQ